MDSPHAVPSRDVRDSNARPTNLRPMAITTAEARTQIVDDLGAATDQITLAVACLAAHELLDDLTADRLEADLFRPVQRAPAGPSAQTRRSPDVTAPRPRRGAPSPGAPSQGVRSFREGAVVAATEASRLIAELQDSMLPIEFGDSELRSGLSETRELVDTLPRAARAFLRTLGR